MSTYCDQCSNEFMTMDCGECNRKLEYRRKKQVENKVSISEIDLNDYDVHGIIRFNSGQGKNINELTFRKGNSSIKEIYYYQQSKFVVLRKEGNLWLSSLHNKNGKCINAGCSLISASYKNIYDLILKKKEKKKKIVYVNLYLEKSGNITTGVRFKTYQEAVENNGAVHCTYLKTVKVELEE